MNYLAHLYLSGDDEEIITGNFIGDDVKGKSFEKFPEKIRKGILLHRQIDSFTDRHPNFREAKKLLNGDYNLYSGIIIDLFYDHFLAQNWSCYSDCTLRTFAKNVHAVLLSHFFYLPKRVQGFLPFLIQNRRLESYASADGIQKSLEIMSRYTSLPENSKKAIEILTTNFSFLKDNFTGFMNDMIRFVETEFEIEISKPGLVILP
jgi:acyl carrier protein phosphodiesterase